MHGVVTILPQPYYAQVEALWDELEENFGLRGIRVTPFPHFSWQIGEEYDTAALQEALTRLSASQPPLQVSTTGLGLFTGERPVLFIPVVKSPQLAAFHQALWEALEPITIGASPYYSPQNWMPHISLVYDDLTAENMGVVLKSLACRTFNWEFTADNLSFIYEPSGVTGTIQVNIMLKGVVETEGRLPA